MGGKSLMKRVVTFSLVCFISLNAEFNVEQINNMVNQIQQKRVSKMNIDYRSVPSPFIVIKMDEDSNKTVAVSPKKQISFNLSAIINHSAFINGKWYKVGDSMSDYKIIEIGDTEVKLENGKNTIELFLPKKPVDIPQIKINEG